MKLTLPMEKPGGKAGLYREGSTEVKETHSLNIRSGREVSAVSFDN